MHKHAGPIINAIGYEILTLVSPKKRKKKYAVGGEQLSPKFA